MDLFIEKTVNMHLSLLNVCICCILETWL